jgi:hypothetical protein
MKAISVFANEDSVSVALKFSKEFLELPYEDRLDILSDAMTQLKFIQARLIERIGTKNESL